MAFHIEISEQGSISQTIRAVELALALDAHGGATVSLDFNGAPWRHLLSGLQQLHLRRLMPQQPAGGIDSNFAPSELTQLWLRPMQLLPACPPEQTWLISTGGAPHKHPELQDLWFGHIQTVAPAMVVDKGRAAAQMPVAICAQTFCPQPTAPAGVVLIGSGDVQADLDMVHRLRRATQQSICVLDVYTHHVGRLLPAGVRIQAVLAPQGRASLYAAHRYVVSGARQVLTDDHFVCEAMHTGVCALAHHTEPANLSWDDASIAKALAKATDQCASPQQRQPPPALMDTRAQAEAINQVIHAVAAQPPYKTGRAAQYCRAQDIKTSTALTAWIDCGRHAEWTDELAAWLVAQPFQTIFVDISRNALLMSMMFTTLLTRQLQDRSKPMPHIQGIDDPNQLVEVIGRHLRQSTQRDIDIVHVTCTLPQVYATRKRLDAIMQNLATHDPQRQLVATHKRPLFYIGANRPKQTTRLSQQMIGAPVAAEGVFQGIVRDSAGRFETVWPRSGDYISGYGRIYYYPFHTNSVHDKEQVDTPQMRQALAEGRIDLMMSGGPLLVQHLYARRLWANKVVPVVGLLHSLHTVVGHFNAVTQQILCSSFASDLYISPTECGKIAHQKQLDATSDALEARCGKPFAYQGEIAVIPYGIDTSWYQNMHKGACRSLLRLPHDRCIILSMARFHRHEKFDLLPVLLAVRSMVHRGDNPLLILAGADRDHNYGQSMQDAIAALNIGDYVEVRTDVASTHKPYLYGACDIFVSPSDNIQETYGLTVIEAMSAGLAVVASEWDGYRELVVDGETGILIPTRWCDIPRDLVAQMTFAGNVDGYGHRDLHESVAIDIEGLTSALRTLYNQPDLRRRMGDAATKRAQSCFDVRKQSRLMTDALLDRVRMAQFERWHPPQLDNVAFIDPVFERFKHYTPNVVDDSLRVATTALAHDDSAIKELLNLADIGQGLESRKLRRLIDTLSTAPMTLGALNAAGFDTLRVMRALKYGFLKVDPCV